MVLDPSPPPLEATLACHVIRSASGLACSYVVICMWCSYVVICMWCYEHESSYHHIWRLRHYHRVFISPLITWVARRLVDVSDMTRRVSLRVHLNICEHESLLAHTNDMTREATCSYEHMRKRESTCWYEWPDASCGSSRAGIQNIGLFCKRAL